jgi:hypothetical protein
MREGSMVSEITKLGPGESFARAERLPPDAKFTAKELSEKADKLADIMRPAATRASTRTGFRYVVETHYHISRARSVVVCGIVTRSL